MSPGIDVRWCPLFQALINLYKAMGGGWITALEKTIAPDKNE